MNDTLQLLLRHGYWIVFAASFLEQMGLPVPAVPIFLTVGALSRAGAYSLGSAILAALIGSIAADLAWYALGRYHGHFILGTICRLSATPSSCVQRTKDLFGRHGSRILLISKFIPGFSAAAIPLAGAERMGLMRFLLFGGAGAVLWASAYTIAGYALRSELDRIADVASSVATGLTVWIVFAIAVILAWKYRRVLLRRNPEL